VEAAEIWRTYLEQCQISMIQDSPGEARTEIEINQETGEVSYKTEDGAKKETPTDELNIQPLGGLPPRQVIEHLNRLDGPRQAGN